MAACNVCFSLIELFESFFFQFPNFTFVDGSCSGVENGHSNYGAGDISFHLFITIIITRVVVGRSVPPGVGGLDGVTFLGCTFQSGSRATRQ